MYCTCKAPKRKMTAESKKNIGRCELWLPSNLTIFLSPAYFSKSIWECEGLIKSSCYPVAKSAGIKHLSTWSIGFKSSMSKLARLFTEPLIRPSAELTRKLGILVYYCASSFTRAFMLEKGLSKISAAMLGSLSPCRRAVTAPIERPHSPTVLTKRSLRR